MRSPCSTSTTSSCRLCGAAIGVEGSTVELIGSLSIAEADAEVAHRRDDVGVERDVLRVTHNLCQRDP